MIPIAEKPPNSEVVTHEEVSICTELILQTCGIMRSCFIHAISNEQTKYNPFCLRAWQSFENFQRRLDRRARAEFIQPTFRNLSSFLH